MGYCASTVTSVFPLLAVAPILCVCTHISIYVIQVAQLRRHEITYLTSCLPTHLITLMKGGIPPPRPAYVSMMTTMVVRVADLHRLMASLPKEQAVALLAEFQQQMTQTAQKHGVFSVAKDDDTFLITPDKFPDRRWSDMTSGMFPDRCRSDMTSGMFMDVVVRHDIRYVSRSVQVRHDLRYVSRSVQVRHDLRYGSGLM